MIRITGPWWENRSARERRVIVNLAVLAALVVLFTMWLQAERTRERLAGQLPQLRASLASLERDAQEVKRLRAMPRPQGTIAQGNYPAQQPSYTGGDGVYGRLQPGAGAPLQLHNSLPRGTGMLRDDGIFVPPGDIGD